MKDKKENDKKNVMKREAARAKKKFEKRKEIRAYRVPFISFTALLSLRLSKNQTFFFKFCPSFVKIVDVSELL